MRSDDGMEEVTAVSVENDIELEEMVENGKANTDEPNNSPKQENGEKASEIIDY